MARFLGTGVGGHEINMSKKRRFGSEMVADGGKIYYTIKLRPSWKLKRGKIPKIGSLVKSFKENTSC